ncbi:hypothetical protein B0H63DRAFT_183615 [Podospora didyma]|uniref:Uncharacterized protein n=1 Tax=Podospora didyma TaxID=330526 RepID=A0AAE0TZU6_9PEZI|nr:hypothetical protein B0H63DRAFT_183615 [Podospora didyma]
MFWQCSGSQKCGVRWVIETVTLKRLKNNLLGRPSRSALLHICASQLSGVTIFRILFAPPFPFFPSILVNKEDMKFAWIFVILLLLSRLANPAVVCSGQAQNAGYPQAKHEYRRQAQDRKAFSLPCRGLAGLS